MSLRVPKAVRVTLLIHTRHLPRGIPDLIACGLAQVAVGESLDSCSNLGCQKNFQKYISTSRHIRDPTGLSLSGSTTFGLIGRRSQGGLS